jgi:hypothetical protein
VAQVYVPPPIRVPVPVNPSPILINREIGRTAARRHAARRRAALRRKKAKATKTPVAKRKVSAVTRRDRDASGQFFTRG